MLIEFGDTKKKIEFKEYCGNKNCVAFLSAEEFRSNYSSFGLSEDDFTHFESDNVHFRTRLESSENFSFVTVKIIEPDFEDLSEICLSFYIMKNLIVIITVIDTEHYARNTFVSTAEKFTKNTYSKEKFISSFIDNLIITDGKQLEEMAEKVDSLEDRVLRKSEYKNFNEEMLRYKKKLTAVRNCYEQLIDVGEALSENSNNIFDGEKLQYFKVFSAKAQRLCLNVDLLRESLVQLRETYQSALDLRLNSTMKLFTVITAIFSPLTLIVGWYGMNFEYMPELSSPYGYLGVIILSIITVAVCIIIFKKKKLM